MLLGTGGFAETLSPCPKTLGVWPEALGIRVYVSPLPVDAVVNVSGYMDDHGFGSGVASCTIFHKIITVLTRYRPIVLELV